MTHFLSISRTAWLIVFASFFLQACSLKPLAWNPKPAPSFEGSLQLNHRLLQTQQIKLDGWYGAEDIVMDASGTLYCGVHKSPDDFSDGKILTISPEGKVDIFYDAGSWVAGLHFDHEGYLLALSHREGLIRISPEREVEVLATQDEYGRPFLIPNGLDVSSEGLVYFSNTSHESAYTISYGRKLILEMRAQGGLHVYDPASKQVKTLIDGTYFGNGIVLSQDETFLLITETTKYRVLKYWLKGEKEGESEVIVDNLPGFPNGISRAPDGHFWLGFTTVRNDALDKIHPNKGMKKLVYALPEWMQPKQELFGMVMKISKQGEILEALYDPSGEKVPEAGAVKEFGGNLYLGGDVVGYISRYELNPTLSSQ